MIPHRRDFLRATLATGLFCAAPLGAARAIEPIARKGKARLQLSLAAYSYNRFLNLRGKDKPSMTLEDFIDAAGGMDLPAVELTAYYFGRVTPEYLKTVKARCDKHKLAVSGTAVGNDFCHTEKEKLTEQLTMVRQWIERTALLGGKTMRIFAGSVKKGDKEADARQRVIDHIHEACKHAEKHKVILALENHGGITATAEQMLAIVQAVKSEHFGVNLDSGNFHTADPYADMAKVAPYAVVAQVKTEVFPGNKRQEADLKRVTDILRKVNFQGYVALEYEGKEDPKVAVPRFVRELKKLVD